MSIYRIAHGLARILIGVVFIYTGAIHIADPAGFAEAVAAYRILPPFSVNAFALLLPWVELLAGLAIATGIGLEGGALAAIGMLAVFLIALAASLYRGLDISCGCFSTSAAADRISWLYLVRDLALLLVALFIFVFPRRRAQREPRALQGAVREGLLVGVPVALAVAGVFLFQHLTRDPCEGVSLASISRHKAFKAPVVLGKRPINGLCEVMLKTENNIVPVYLGKGFAIAGGMFQDRRDITGEGLKLITSQKFLALKREIDQAVAFRYTPSGPARQVLYLFASPTCPYCEELLWQIRPLLDETRTELRVLLTARGQASALAIAALCRKVDLEGYLAKQWMPSAEKALPACSDAQARLERANDLTRRLDVSAVPTVFTAQGLMLRGPQLGTIRSLLQEAPVK